MNIENINKYTKDIYLSGKCRDNIYGGIYDIEELLEYSRFVGNISILCNYEKCFIYIVYSKDDKKCEDERYQGRLSVVIALKESTVSRRLLLGELLSLPYEEEMLTQRQDIIKFKSNIYSHLFDFVKEIQRKLGEY